LFLTDVAGVRDENEVWLDSISAADAHQLIAKEIATGGMALKLRAAVAALKSGVAKVRVGPLEMLWDATAGTTVHTERRRVGIHD
jgi:acetylglutamate kinase